MSIKSYVSDEVRSFYERLPYPAPLTNLDRHLELYRNPERRRALFHLMFPTENPRSGQQILVAGCGTSQAATIALREPDAQVTAIDLSETQLALFRSGKVKGIRFSTLTRMCEVLDCLPGDLLGFDRR